MCDLFDDFSSGPKSPAIQAIECTPWNCVELHADTGPQVAGDVYTVMVSQILEKMRLMPNGALPSRTTGFHTHDSIEVNKVVGW